MSNLHGMCRSLLKEARLKAKEISVVIPKLEGTYKHGGMNFEVKFKNTHSINVSACCAYEARYRAVLELILEKEE